MIFCKYLWDTLKRDMGREPAVGWNVSKTYGPVYLFLERYAGPKKRAKTYDNEEAHLPDVVLEVSAESGRGGEHSSHRRGAGPKPTLAPPTAEEITQYVEDGIRDNTFSNVLEVVSNSQYYTETT